MDKIKITKDESINCVKTSTWKLMWTDYRKWSIFVLLIFLFLLSFFVVIIYLISLLPNLNILYFLFSSFVLLTISFVFPITYYTLLKEKVQKKFMMEFANANNFSYKEYDLSKGSVNGGLFKYGKFLGIRNIISGHYKNHKIRLFNYTLEKEDTGKNKNREIEDFTVFEIFFKETNFPNILLSSRKMGIYYSGKKILRVPLEDEFSKDFSLFCKEGYEIEALQIFTPELLSFLRDKGLKFSIEFTEDRLYIFEKGFIGKREHLYELYRILQMILDSYGPLLQRIQKDFKVLDEYYK